MADNVLGALFEGIAGPGKPASAGTAETALETFRANATATFQSVAEASRRASPALSQTTAELQRLAVASGTAYNQMNRHVQGWSQTATTSFARVAEQILRHISIEKQSAVESGRAEAQKTLLHKVAVQERAVVEAVKETAAGLAALGDFNFYSAAQHFASAALWGSLAALQIAGAVGAFGSGGGGSRAGTGSRVSGAGAGPGSGYVSPGPTPALSAGAAGAATPGGSVNVMIMGEPEGAQWLAGVLNKHVTQRGGKLVASQSVRPVPAGA